MGLAVEMVENLMLQRFGVSRRWSELFDIVVLGFAFVGAVQLVAWIDRNPPITIHFRVIQTSSARPGGVFTYTNFFTRHKYCDTFVRRWFVASDTTLRDIEPLPTGLPTEALHIRQRSQVWLKVPSDMPPGVSKSCFQVKWECNPIQQVWPLQSPVTCLSFVVKPPIKSPSFL